MRDFSTLSDKEIDSLLLSVVSERWQKVAMIISKAMDGIEDWKGDHIDARLEKLVAEGVLESVGNIKEWRHSEIKLPIRH